MKCIGSRSPVVFEVNPPPCHRRAENADSTNAARFYTSFEPFHVTGNIGGRQKLVHVRSQRNVISADGILECINVRDSKINIFQRNAAPGQQSTGLFEADF